MSVVKPILCPECKQRVNATAQSRDGLVLLTPCHCTGQSQAFLETHRKSVARYHSTFADKG